ncbi:hypothetical protein [Hypsugo bat coronavirus HKU25]|uniref:ORF4a n=2 Tax=Orthocoronavirinae TaxID=2501931 RepID=A0A678T7P9_MERS|nr:hypothetical protein [Hypsugo bat coronavirus HKU25]ASL68955.1 hypothetical protein [Hypsugo bat coronavirus HKU25]AWH65945.1 ORF4a [Middle East respiratory syndrome-related coronavirus]AWH65956.1 ORF4a [Middle East respiratory syndrome-related coronavirus]WCC63258.1 ORF4a protein [Bat Coronavirus PaGD16]
MDYVSLLNQVWQHYTNSAVDTGVYIPPPVVAFLPVPGTSLHPVQWHCQIIFDGIIEQAVNSSKALAKQDAARQIAWRLHKQGKLSGINKYALRWRFT